VFLPRGQGMQFFWVLHVVEKRQHLAKFGRRIGRNAPHAIFRVEPFQALVREAPDLHLPECSLLLNTCQSDSRTFAQAASLLALGVVTPGVEGAREAEDNKSGHSREDYTQKRATIPVDSRRLFCPMLCRSV